MTTSATHGLERSLGASEQRSPPDFVQDYRSGSGDIGVSQMDDLTDYRGWHQIRESLLDGGIGNFSCVDV